MASIPCAAYQVTYIHDNLRRKQRNSAPLAPHQVRAIEQLSGVPAPASTIAGPHMMDKTNSQWFNLKTWSMPWLSTIPTGASQPVPAK